MRTKSRAAVLADRARSRRSRSTAPRFRLRGGIIYLPPGRYDVGDLPGVQFAQMPRSSLTIARDLSRDLDTRLSSAKSADEFMNIYRMTGRPVSA